jgi:MoxR-like ATPase
VLDPRFEESAAAFRRFFLELREGFLERDALFVQLELALLCREHVLIIGPPGTAKSAVASAVLGRIVDEATGRPSLFSKQLAENTVQTDLIGPVDFKVLTETGRTEYLTEEGMLGSVHAFLDEVFDGRDMLLRSILNVLHERELKHGRKVTPGRCECAVMTSNRYLSEVVQRSP